MKWKILTECSPFFFPVFLKDHPQLRKKTEICQNKDLTGPDLTQDSAHMFQSLSFVFQDIF